SQSVAVLPVNRSPPQTREPQPRAPRPLTGSHALRSVRRRQPQRPVPSPTFSPLPSASWIANTVGSLATPAMQPAPVDPESPEPRMGERRDGTPSSFSTDNAGRPGPMAEHSGNPLYIFNGWVVVQSFPGPHGGWWQHLDD